MWLSIIVVVVLSLFALVEGEENTPSNTPSLSFVERYGLHLGPQELKLPREPHNAAFIHSAVGVFAYTRKDRVGQKWGYGKEILFEMLETMYKVPGFVDSLDTIYICLLGAPEDILDARRSVNARFGSDNRTMAQERMPLRSRRKNRRKHKNLYWPKDVKDKIRFVLEGNNKYIWEFPTLSIMQYYASVVHPESKLLYVHTKGVRRNAASDKTITQWRRYMMYWMVESGVCYQQALESGYDTCGALKRGGPRGNYGGNFWWTKSKYLSERRPRMEDINWSVNETLMERFGAEEYLLKDATPEEHRSKHYCVHHTHQDMNVCQTFPKFYRLDIPTAEEANDVEMRLRKPSKYTLRAHGNCFDPAKMANKGKSKDPKDWCFRDKFPSMD